MNKHFKSVAILTIICATVAILLAFTNSLTAPIIEKQEKEKASGALLEVLPDGEDFNAIDISKYELPDSITAAHSEKNGGYVLEMEVTGYKPGMKILCGIDKNGVIKGAKCLSSGETNGAEKTYGNKFVDKTAED